MKKRMFTAIDISGEARQKVCVYIESLRRQFPDLRAVWEKPEKIHLTLKFFGDVDEFDLKSIEEAVENTAFQIPDFKLEILSTGVFPNAENPKILWLGLKDGKFCLNKTRELLENECEKFGFEKENRNFKPHLTIARIREPHKSKKLAETPLKKFFEPVEFRAGSIVIYESTLLPTGSIYRKIKSFNF